MIHLAPQTPTGYVYRGYAYVKKGDFEKAIVDFTEAIRLNPKHAWAYLSRAHAYMNVDHEKALADFREVIKLEPNNASAYFNRGWLYRKQGHLDEAIARISRRRSACGPRCPPVMSIAAVPTGRIAISARPPVDLHGGNSSESEGRFRAYHIAGCVHTCDW